MFIAPVRQTVDAGESTSFNCSFTGFPVRAVTWYKDGLPLVADQRVSVVISLATGKSQVVIASVDRQDRGMYQCFVSNENNEVEASAQLALGGKWQIFRKMQNKVGQNQRILMHKRAECWPTPKKQRWPGQKCKPGRRVVLKFAGKNPAQMWHHPRSQFSVPNFFRFRPIWKEAAAHLKRRTLVAPNHLKQIQITQEGEPGNSFLGYTSYKI